MPIVAGGGPSHKKKKLPIKNADNRRASQELEKRKQSIRSPVLLADAIASQSTKELLILNDQSKYEKRDLEKFSVFWDGVRSVYSLWNSRILPEKAEVSNQHPHLGSEWDEWLSAPLESTDIDRNEPTAEGFTEENLKQMQEQRLFNPRGEIKVIWDVLTAIVVLYSILEVPIRICFLGDLPLDAASLALEIVVTIIFAIDIIFNFNTAYRDEKRDVMVTSRDAISMNYLSFWCPIDVITTIPFGLIEGGGKALNSIRILRVLRIFRLWKLGTTISNSGLKQFLESYGVSQQSMGLMVLFFRIFLVGHYWACFWYYLTTPEVTQQSIPTYDEHKAGEPFLTRTWVSEFGFQYQDTASKYISALYFAFATLLTVGYGDIHPTNLNERIMAIFMMLTGSIMFGNIVAKVRELIESANLLQKDKTAKLDELSEYLEEKLIPGTLKLTIKDAYAYYLNKRASLAEDGLFNTLPTALRLRLISHTYRKEIEIIDCFRKGDLPFVVDLVVRTIPVLSLKEHLVYGMHDMATEMTFVVNGKIRIVVSVGEQERLIGFASQGNFIGDAEHNQKCTRYAHYQAAQSSALLALSYKDLDHTVENHPLSGARFLAELARRRKTFLAVLRNHYATHVLLDHATHEHSHQLFASERQKSSIHPHQNNNSSSNNRKSSSAQATGFNENHSSPGLPSSSSSPRRASRKLSTSPHQQQMNETGSSVMDKQPSSSVKDEMMHGLAALSTPLKDVLLTGSFKSSHKEFRYHVDDEHQDASNPRRPELWIGGQLKTFFTHQDLLVLLANESYLSSTSEGFTYTMLTIQNGKEALYEDTAISVRKQGLLHPHDTFKVNWDIFLGLLIIYSVVTTPLTLAFDAYPGAPIFDFIVDCFFFLDVIASFNTAYYSHKHDAYIVDRQRITAYYFKFWFYIDIISSIPIDTFVTLGDSAAEGGNFTAIQLFKTFRLLRLAKLFRMIDLTKQQNYLEVNFGLQPGVFGMILIVANVFVIGHFLCCIWWGICTAITTNAWYDDASQVYEPLREAPFYMQYWTSMYWAITTLTATGYGDIVPANSSERCVATFIFVFGASIFGYTTANVAGIFAGFTRREAHVSSRINMVLEFLLSHNVPTAMLTDVMGHSRIVIKNSSMYDEEMILQRLPLHIRTQLFIYENRDIIKVMPLFRLIANESVQMHLLKMMTKHVASAGRHIVREGDNCTELVFLVKGSAVVSRMTKLGRKEAEIKMYELRMNMQQISAPPVEKAEYSEGQAKSLTNEIRRLCLLENNDEKDRIEMVAMNVRALGEGQGQGGGGGANGGPGSSTGLSGGGGGGSGGAGHGGSGSGSEVDASRNMDHSDLAGQFKASTRTHNLSNNNNDNNSLNSSQPQQKLLSQGQKEQNLPDAASTSSPTSDEIVGVGVTGASNGVTIANNGVAISNNGVTGASNDAPLIVEDLNQEETIGVSIKPSTMAGPNGGMSMVGRKGSFNGIGGGRVLPPLNSPSLLPLKESDQPPTIVEPFLLSSPGEVQTRTTPSIATGGEKMGGGGGGSVEQMSGNAQGSGPGPNHSQNDSQQQSQLGNANVSQHHFYLDPLQMIADMSSIGQEAISSITQHVAHDLSIVSNHAHDLSDLLVHRTPNIHDVKNSTEATARALQQWTFVREKLPIIAKTQERRQAKRDKASNKLGSMLIANIKLALAEEEALERKQKLQEDRDRLARKKAQKYWWRRGPLGKAFSFMSTQLGANKGGKVGEGAAATSQQGELGGIDVMYDEISGGYRHLVMELSPGEFVGHREIRASNPHPCSVVAIEPCTYYTLARSNVLDLMDAYPSIALNLQAELGRAIQEATLKNKEELAKKGKMEFLNDIKKRYKKEEEKQRKLKAQKGFSALLFANANANEDQTKVKRKIIIKGLKNSGKGRMGQDGGVVGRIGGIRKIGSGTSVVAGMADVVGGRGARTNNSQSTTGGEGGNDHDVTDTIPPTHLHQKPTNTNNNRQRKQIKKQRASFVPSLASVAKTSGAASIGTTLSDQMKSLSRVLPLASTIEQGTGGGSTSAPAAGTIVPYEKKDAAWEKKQDSIWHDFDALSSNYEERERMNRMRDHPHRRSFADIYAINKESGLSTKQNTNQNNLNRTQKRKSWNNIISLNEE